MLHCSSSLALADNGSMDHRPIHRERDRFLDPRPERSERQDPAITYWLLEHTAFRFGWSANRNHDPSVRIPCVPHRGTTQSFDTVLRRRVARSERSGCKKRIAGSAESPLECLVQHHLLYISGRLRLRQRVSDRPRPDLRRCQQL